MGSTARKAVIKIQSDWLCRDLSSWRVRVPCVGGSGRFTFKEYGGSEKALKAARKFQKHAIKLLYDDREYYSKHGEMPYREALPITNTSGHLGVYRIVHPTQSGNPLIVWYATWTHNKKPFKQGYSTANYTESECKKRAIKKRKEMMAHVLLPTN
jgi:hypothetical protein